MWGQTGFAGTTFCFVNKNKFFLRLCRIQLEFFARLARITPAFLFAQMSETDRKSIIMSGAPSLKQTGPYMNETSPLNKTTVTIKKYANRRLYNTATSSYVTLESLAVMVKEGIEFNVYDAKTSEDITRSVLTQIIVEE
jgi:hypothetical protein